MTGDCYFYLSDYSSVFQALMHKLGIGKWREGILTLEVGEERSRGMRTVWIYSMAWIKFKIKADQLNIFQHFKRLDVQCKSMASMTWFSVWEFGQKRPVNQIQNIQRSPKQVSLSGRLHIFCIMGLFFNTSCNLWLIQSWSAQLLNT